MRLIDPNDQDCVSSLCHFFNDLCSYFGKIFVNTQVKTLWIQHFIHFPTYILLFLSLSWRSNSKQYFLSPARMLTARSMPGRLLLPLLHYLCMPVVYLQYILRYVKVLAKVNFTDVLLCRNIIAEHWSSKTYIGWLMIMMKYNTPPPQFMNKLHSSNSLVKFVNLIK